MSDIQVKDINGNFVSVGDSIEVLKLPNVEFSPTEIAEVQSMIGNIYEIESIEHGCIEVTKWFNKDQASSWCHSLYLFSDEFRSINNDKAS